MRDQNAGASKEALFCIGSNCGDRQRNVDSALSWLARMLGDFRHSSVYASPDCHGGHRVYMNSVAVGTTALDPKELDRLCKEFELSLGRDAAARAAGDVPVDVDIVVYDGVILRRKDYGCGFFRKGFKELALSEAFPSCGED